MTHNYNYFSVYYTLSIILSLYYTILSFCNKNYSMFYHIRKKKKNENQIESISSKKTTQEQKMLLYYYYYLLLQLTLKMYH